MPYRSASRTAWVPLPEPGGPIRTRLSCMGGVCPVGGHGRYGRPDELIAAVPEQRSIPEHEGPSIKAWCRWPSVSYADWLSGRKCRTVHGLSRLLRSFDRGQPARRRARPRLPGSGSPPQASCSAPAKSSKALKPDFKYAVERLLGEGGFGQVYLARRLGRSRDVPEILCIKVSTRIDGWLREAYFGQLLDEHPRAIRIFDTFPLLGGGPGALLPRPRVRAFRRSERLPAAPCRRLAGEDRPARDRGNPRRARQAAPRPAAPSRPDAAERLRLRRPSAQARRLRHRAAAERSPRHHCADDERADGAQRHSGRSRAEVAGARRCLPGRPAAGHADQGGRAGAASNA